MGKTGECEEHMLVITGLTAIGKTSTSLIVAEQLGGEIISCDSMKVYKFMDIGTAKPSAEARRRVTHHIIDVVAPDEPYNVAMFLRDAEKAIAEIRSRGKLPIVVGGTALYLSALLEDYNLPIAPPCEELRQRLRMEAAERGTRALHEQLMSVDPLAASKIHPNDLVRIVRALEVYELTGKPISHHWGRGDGDERIILERNAIVIGLTASKEWVRRRIDERAIWMLEAGLLDEIKWLLKAGYSPDLKPMQALGYREYTPVVLGQKKLEEALDEFKRNSYKFEKRQRTWFKKRRYIQWINVEGMEVGEVASEIVRRFLLATGVIL
ncbi:MAG: tRNA (adenosine(37)-N6)-dimethylallyltransferase MiaA [Armatimonadota bacterium]|nr:tRNA (adenosine(37)-N6)-dimethylallyltransferase MiaA [Armatimonadota bacterium]MCX7778091.1 tRNA (adenosine(37)-N6)-dimethylallyltransferase MiaA [Armatimonadota bacterium]MDW8025481.1 tRNA (adenosine(37)-N6)-dimethylallyltransferase MiaA [Armatimonadota bacterium]